MTFNIQFAIWLTLAEVTYESRQPTHLHPTSPEALRKQPSTPRTRTMSDSSLSSMSSSSEAGDEYEQVTHDVTMDEIEPPAKRLKLGDVGSATPSAVVAEADPEVETKTDDFDDAMSISSDSSGDIPSSPANARLEDEDFQPQVTVCVWEDCGAGDLGTMDRLVKHIHDEHIEGRQKKYTCQWIGCSRQGANHASGYALKAHMRSHTREKPFFCYLPGEAQPLRTRVMYITGSF